MKIQIQSMAGVLGMLLMLSGTAVRAADPAPAVLDLTVTDSGGKPIAGAVVTTNGGPKNNNKVTTGADGHASVPLPAQALAYVSAIVHAEGFVDTVVEWRSPRVDPVPATYALQMDRSTLVSGRVIDDAGQPVSGAHIVLFVRKKVEKPHQRTFSNSNKTTDKDGKWTSDGVPPDGAAVEVGVWDYRYANGEFYPMTEMTDAQIKDGSMTSTLARGVPIDGFVLKPDGTPLAGARVATGGQMASNRVPPLRTDKDGHFAYAAKPGDKVVLTFTAKGYSTELTQFIMGAGKHDVSIQMAKSTPLVGHVVDPDGKPVANAMIFPDTWRGFRSLEVRIRTDKNGKFTWADAPTDTVLCDVDATQAGFTRERGVAITPSDQDIVVKVRRALAVKGTVVDAETGDPIDSFKLIHGISFDKDRPVSWERRQTDLGHQGKFEFSPTFPYPGYAVRIEADGYLPGESRVFTTDEKDVVLELKLKKGQSITATVQTTDGTPAAGVKVFMLMPGSNLQIVNGRETYNRESAQVTTGADGKCVFPPETGAFKLVALGDGGYLEVESGALSKTGEIRLTPWGKIEGKLMMGSKPWPSQKVSVQMMNEKPYDPKEARVFQQIQTTTDAKGAFSFDRVPAGKALIGRMVETRNGQYSTSMYSNMQPVEFVGGKTTNVTVGGQGRPVEGRIIIPAELAKRSDWSWGGWGNEAQTKSKLADFPMPANVKKGPQEEQRKWMMDFIKSDAGQAFQRARNEEARKSRNYPLEIGADGKFRLIDVVSGTYQVNVTAVQNAMPDNRGMINQEPLASGTAEFTVAEIPGGLTDEAMVLQDIQMKLLPHVMAGDIAPDFPFKTTDGKELKLSELKGKYVLLDFFSQGNGDDTIDLPALKSASASFGGDDRFSMLGVDIYGSVESSRKYAEAKGMSWRIGISADQEHGPMNSFGFHRLPSIWLIGPDGKVLARDLHGDAIKSALTTAIGPQGL